MLDIQKIVNDTTKELLDNGIIKETIENGIKKSIIGAIEGKFNYGFEHELRDKLSKDLDPALKNVDLSGYSNMILERFKTITNNVIDSELIEKVERHYKDIFIADKGPIKLSKLFEVIRDYWKSDDACYCGEEEYFSAIITYNATYKWYSVGFQREKISASDSQDHYRYDNYMTISEYDGKWKVLSLSLDSIKFGRDNESISRIGYLSEFERILINAYFNHTEIDVDVDDVDNIDLSLSDYDY